MKKLDARVGDLVRETAKGPDAPEMRICSTDGCGSHLHCEWKGERGREEATFVPAELELVSKRGEPAKATEGS